MERPPSAGPREAVECGEMADGALAERGDERETTQQPGSLRLADLWPRPPAWDVSAFVGWRAVRYRPFGYAQFSNRTHAGLTAGYYWTSHVKTEAEIGWSSQSRLQAGHPVDYDIPGLSYRPMIWTEHAVQDTAVISLIGLYQFGEDAMFHPNVGVGVEMARTRDQTMTPPQSVSPGGGRPDVVLVPERQTATDTRVTAHALVTAGFKYYATPRLFLRADLRGAMGKTPGNISGRFGLGFDF